MKSKALYLIVVALTLNLTGCDRREDPFPEEPFDFSIIDSEPAWSPDGQFIIYSNTNNDFTKEVLWKIDINGNNKIQLTY